MGFWIATAALDGSRIVGSEVELSPGPTRVVYSQDAAGSILETDDQSVVHQQPTLDGRRRQWEWVNYYHYMAAYQRTFPLLEAQRSVDRVELGLSPYTWLKEDVSGGLRRKFTDSGTGSGSGITFTDGTATWTAGALVGGFIIAVGQPRAIIGNTTTTITVGNDFVGSPSGAYQLQYFAGDWFRVRVLEVSRQSRDDGGIVKYPSSRIVFVIDDDNSRDLLG